MSHDQWWRKTSIHHPLAVSCAARGLPELPQHVPHGLISHSPLPPRNLTGAGTAKPISSLTIQKGYAECCSHTVYEDTQDIYYISGGRTGALIASVGCKL